MCKRWTVYVLVLLFGFTEIASEKYKYKLIGESRSWTDADQDCRSRDGTLVVLDTHYSVVEFQKLLQLEPSLPVWTAAYRQHSPWVWVEGCFSATFLTRNDGIQLSRNQASECSSVCKSFAYAALRDHVCFCLEDVRDLGPLNAQKCDIPCPGSTGEMCGGREGAVSLYSLGGVNGYKESDTDIAEQMKQTVHEMSRSDWKNCVYILKHGDPVWITTDCRKTMPFLCKIYRESGSVIEYMSPKNKVASWTQARDLCKKEGGTLADLHANKMEAVRALPNHSEFWVGLYRNTSWAWRTDDLEENPSWCTTVSEDNVGELQFKTESCSLPRKYVCQIPVHIAVAQNGHMVAYLVTGTVVWVLAVVTAIFVACMVKKRYCCKKSSSGSTGQLRRSYFDLDEESNASGPPRPARQHSYVNSDVNNRPTCSQPPPFEPPLKPGASKSTEQSARFHSSNGNEYASVCMLKVKEQNHSYNNHMIGGACANEESNRGSTSTEGDYDIVWDSMKFQKQLESKGNNRASTSSDNIYTEIERVTHVNMSKSARHHAELFPPSSQFGQNVPTKQPLDRTRSKSL